MLLFCIFMAQNIGICNSGVGKMKHPAFIFVLTKKEVLMVSVELKQEKTQCPRQFPDDCHSGIVPALYGQFIGTFYKSVLGKLFHRRAAGIEGIQVKSLPLSQNILPMILYFTATGNSRWIAELLAEAMHDTAVSIVDCLKQGSIPAGLSTAGQTGYCFPVHSWYAPRV